MKLRKSVGKNQTDWSLGVPRELAAVLEARGVMNFQVVLTEDGILYKPESEITDKLPAWLRDEVERRNA